MTLRHIGAVVVCALACALSISAAEATQRQKAPLVAAVALTYCVADQSYRTTCGQVEKRIQSPKNGGMAYASLGSYGSLVDRARRYMGTNPTGKASLWCGRFMAMIAPAAAAKIRNPDMARDWADLPRTSPQAGAIAVMTRGKRGGHVGVVTGFDANGNPIIVSGNHNRVVGEGVYPKSRVIAYVSPS